jgi:arylsulfatase A-like enzyme
MVADGASHCLTPRTAVLGLLALVTITACSAPDPRPNVVLVSIDTLRRDALPTRGEDLAELPSLHRLVNESVVYETALSPASWTLPAHASVLTGLYPDRHGATDVRTTMDPNATRLPQILRRAGYTTAAFTGGGFVGRAYGMDAGFDRFDEVPEVPAEHAVGRRLGPFERAREFLGDHRSNTPFLLLVHSYVVHDYNHYGADVGFHDPEDTGTEAERYLDCLVGRATCGPATWDRLQRLYGFAVETAFAAVDDLLEALERSGLRDRTVVILFSDHGEGFDVELQRTSHGGRLHADLLDIPLLIRAPAVPPRHSSEPASLVDVMPTVLHLCGLDPLTAGMLDGRSLAAPGDGGPSPGSRMLLAFEHGFYWRQGRRFQSDNIQDRALAVAAVDDASWWIRSSRTLERYDRTHDPRQATNLWNGEAWPEERLHRRPQARPVTPLIEDHNTVFERLRALGYLEDDGT